MKDEKEDDKTKYCPLNKFKLCDKELCALYTKMDGDEEDCSLKIIARSTAKIRAMLQDKLKE